MKSLPVIACALLATAQLAATSLRAQMDNSAVSHVATDLPLPVSRDAQPAASPEAAADVWFNIKDFSFDQRDDFLKGAAVLEATIAQQMEQLATRRAAMEVRETPSTADWDFAMKEMREAGMYFRATVAEAAKANPDNWAQHKDRVRAAWGRAQDAYDRVRMSSTG